MTAYFVLGSITVAWALLLAALGLMRENFPPSGSGLRAIVGITIVLVVGTIAALMATTEKEHPREEAAEHAAHANEAANVENGAGGATVRAVETEFAIDLPGGDEVEAGPVTLDVVNEGTTAHDLAVEGDGVDDKTKLLEGGQRAKLAVSLKPGTYKLYCTVPGHEQQGMKADLAVE
jgi:uncharacterized cupredoxin-like copper-binding protein